MCTQGNIKINKTDDFCFNKHIWHVCLKKILFLFNDPGNNCDFGWNVKHFSLHYKEISSFLDRTVKGLI